MDPTHDDDAVMDGAPVFLRFSRSKLDNHLRGFFPIRCAQGQNDNPYLVYTNSENALV
jgi:hypothetical protein